MTTRPDGGTDCDNCGRDVGAGSLLLALHVGDLDPDNVGQVRNLRFCRLQQGDAEGFVPCAEELLRGMTRHLDQTRAATREAAAPRQETPVPDTVDDDRIAAPNPGPGA